MLFIGGRLASGTNAPLYTSGFAAARPMEKDQLDKHERRIAQALDLNRTGRVFEFRDRELSISPQKITSGSRATWKGSEWVVEGSEFKSSHSSVSEHRSLPESPFK
jgi:meiosis-specific APC/C activator protein AMA1